MVTQVPPDLTQWVVAENWPAFRDAGFRHVTNIEQRGYGHYAWYYDNFDGESMETVAILEWELGKENVREGHPLVKGVVTDNDAEADHPNTDVYYLGVYAKTPFAWTTPWKRSLWHDDPRVVKAGLAAHLYMGFTGISRMYEQRWQIWSVFGSRKLYRCWGPSSFEGTFNEVVAFIKGYEAKESKEAFVNHQMVLRRLIPGLFLFKDESNLGIYQLHVGRLAVKVLPRRYIHLRNWKHWITLGFN